MVCEDLEKVPDLTLLHRPRGPFLKIWMHGFVFQGCQSSQGSQNPSISVAFWSVRGLLACMEICWMLDMSGALTELHWPRGGRVYVTCWQIDASAKPPKSLTVF